MGKYAKLIKAYNNEKTEECKKLFSELCFLDILEIIREQYPDQIGALKIALYGQSPSYLQGFGVSNPLVTELLKMTLSDKDVYSKVFNNRKRLHHHGVHEHLALVMFLEISPNYFSKNEWQEIEAVLVKTNGQELLSSLANYPDSAVLDRVAKHKLSSETNDTAQKHLAKKKQPSYDPRLHGGRKTKKEAIAQHENKEKLFGETTALPI